MRWKTKKVNYGNHATSKDGNCNYCKKITLSDDLQPLAFFRFQRAFLLRKPTALLMVPKRVNIIASHSKEINKNKDDIMITQCCNIPRYNVNIQRLHTTKKAQICDRKERRSYLLNIYLVVYLGLKGAIGMHNLVINHWKIIPTISGKPGNKR